MRQTRNRSSLVLAAVTVLGLTGIHIAIAQEAPEVSVDVSASKCSGSADGIAYDTSPEFIAWLLEKPERMRPISDADLRAIFKSFAEQQAWRKSIATGG